MQSTEPFDFSFMDDQSFRQDLNADGLADIEFDSRHFWSGSYDEKRVYFNLINGAEVTVDESEEMKAFDFGDDLIAVNESWKANMGFAVIKVVNGSGSSNTWPYGSQEKVLPVRMMRTDSSRYDYGYLSLKPNNDTPSIRLAMWACQSQLLDFQEEE